MQLDPKALTRIYDTNAKYKGIKVVDMMEKAGEGIADLLIEKYGEEKKYSFICGLGNNGGDGLVAARYLIQKGAEKVLVYLIGDPKDIKTESSRKNWETLVQMEDEKLKIKDNSFSNDIEPTDILVECLVGTGIEGKLKSPFDEVIEKISTMDVDKVAVDIPTGEYSPDLVISLHFKKHPDAEIVDIGIPPEVANYVGPGEVNELHKPGKDDYKTKTGELFVFGGSPRFHGAPLMAIMAASKFIGSVYFYTTPENREIVNKIKSEVLEFIIVEDSDIEKYAEYADTFLIGPGLEDNLANRSIVEKLFSLHPDKKKVIDAYAIAMVSNENLQNCVITPHKGELRHIWPDSHEEKLEYEEENIKKFSQENEVITVLKGSTDKLFNKDGKIKYNDTGNAGMAKGGTGDVLSGMIAALACKNDLWLAAMAGTFINGKAGDLAYDEFGYNYSATDLVPFLQKVPKWAEDFKH